MHFVVISWKKKQRDASKQNELIYTYIYIVVMTPPNKNK